MAQRSHRWRNCSCGNVDHLMIGAAKPVVGLLMNTVVHWAAPDDSTLPLVVLLHGRGANEMSIAALAAELPTGFSYVSARGPIVLGPNAFTWFENRGIGRPLASSLAETMGWFRGWLDQFGLDRPIILIGYSGGCAFAGGLLLSDPARFRGVALVNGTLPFDAGVPTERNQLKNVAVLFARSMRDDVIPVELLDRTASFLVESGANLTAIVEPSGHELTESVVTQLHDWLSVFREVQHS
jgi:phospholipase/carboxylesterase